MTNEQALVRPTLHTAKLPAPMGGVIGQIGNCLSVKPLNFAPSNFGQNMDETTYEVSAEGNRVRVHFDLRTEENCFIDLSFSEDDVLAIINMKHFGQNRIPVKSIGGVASLDSGKPSDRNICLAYRN